MLMLFSWETLTKLLESVQKYVIHRFLQRKSLIFSNFSYKNNRICMFVHCNGPKLPKCENTEKSRTDGLSWANNVCTTEFSVEVR